MLYALLRGLWYMASGFEDRFTPWSTEPRDDYWAQLTKLAGKYLEEMIVYESGDVRTILTPAHRLQGINNDDPRIAEGVEVALRALDDMHMQCKKQGTEFLVVLLPTKEYTFYPYISAKNYNVDAMEKMHRLARFENEIHERIFAVLEAKETDYLDMLPVFRNVITQDQQNPYFESLNGHYNALGNKLIARSIAAQLQEKMQEM
jgi:hypothetical protein